MHNQDKSEINTLVFTPLKPKTRIVLILLIIIGSCVALLCLQNIIAVWVHYQTIYTGTIAALLVSLFFFIVLPLQWIKVPTHTIVLTEAGASIKKHFDPKLFIQWRDIQSFQYNKEKTDTFLSINNPAGFIFNDVTTPSSISYQLKSESTPRTFTKSSYKGVEKEQIAILLEEWRQRYS